MNVSVNERNGKGLASQVGALFASCSPQVVTGINTGFVCRGNPGSKSSAGTSEPT